MKVSAQGPGKYCNGPGWECDRGFPCLCNCLSSRSGGHRGWGRGRGTHWRGLAMPGRMGLKEKQGT